ncbi:MAG: precorrin-3B C(17)-methyltransferase [Rhizobiales bacterium]|nr:precorrin-3B C(17)-methyltransferase [Hyphomicrobiales bacterium]
MVRRPAIFARAASAPLAARIAEASGGDIVEHADGALIASLQTAFRDERPIIAILPPPILIRALASLLDSKFTDPPVVSVTSDGRFVIPLLGLNHGAVALAARIAEAIGATRAGGAATEARFGIALDDPPTGYRLANPTDYKDFAVSLLAGEAVSIAGSAPWLVPLPKRPDAPLRITLTEQTMEGSPAHLVFHPATLAVGVGCERGTSLREVADLVAQTLRGSNLSPAAIACYASIELKEDEPAIASLGDRDHVRFFTAEELAEQSARIANPSALVERETGTPSVAEAAALAAAGADAELIVPKTKSRRATCAIARARAPILSLGGRPRGRLAVIGLGPGDPGMRTPAVQHALAQATDWVGYGLYLDLAADQYINQTLHNFALGEEEARVRHAIALAKEGKHVALLCSGDAGIYAMAALVYELLELEPTRVEVEVLPGISAFQAAAAKAGAMIGHDFCCISLSDLLTPWPVIEKRIRAAAEGDFVVAFYNPRSAKRRDQIERAMAILSQYRPPDTPVVIASNLGRKEESVAIVPLSEFRAQIVDMMTLVMVGSSQSRAFRRGDGMACAYTPRGYAARRTGG